MNRTKFYNKFTINNINELDFLQHSLSKLKLNYEVSYYRVREVDIKRPDLISFKNYGTVKYWWIICYVNGILNPLKDIEVGKLLTIPNVIDIYDFYRKYRKR